jgi:peptidoglycan L-alanyl-D-glutamate endopeptidase CwlK
MPRFSNLSEQRLATCDERLQRILQEAIKHVDFTVICGHRDQEEQDDAFRTGRSKARWPLSKHNRLPSVAVDVAPYPVDWQDTARFARLAGYIERIADEMGVQIRWGGDWDGDGRTRDERFIDMPHIELVE